MSDTETSTVGLVLTGGGARGAYQAGVIQGLSEILPNQAGLPFRVLSGTSAGAINTAFLATRANMNFQEAAKELSQLWENLHSDSVFKTEATSLFKIGFKWVFELAMGGTVKEKRVRSLLDTSPLRSFLEKVLPMEDVKKNIDAGYLQALALTAMNISTSATISFYEALASLEPWERVRRYGVRHTLTLDHVLASAAIPILFPPVKIEDHFYGDGSLRNYAPLSPAIRLGANKLIVIAVRMGITTNLPVAPVLPTVGRVMGLILNSVLLDAVDLDLERLSRINSTVRQIASQDKTPLREVPFYVIRPSIDIGNLAYENEKELTQPLRHLVKGLGTKKDAQDLISYLLFEPQFTRKLIEAGRQDVFAQKDEIRKFLA